MKKYLIILLLFSLACLCHGQVANAQIFTDVQAHWAKGYIGQLSDAKVICSYPETVKQGLRLMADR